MKFRECKKCGAGKATQDGCPECGEVVPTSEPATNVADAIRVQLEVERSMVHRISVGDNRQAEQLYNVLDALEAGQVARALRICREEGLSARIESNISALAG